MAAEADLDAIFDHIAHDNARHAIDFTRKIREQCQQLADFSERGTRRDDLGPGLRTIGFKRRVTILFRVLPGRVQIVRISYGGREMEGLVRKRRPN